MTLPFRWTSREIPTRIDLMKQFVVKITVTSRLDFEGIFLHRDAPTCPRHLSALIVALKQSTNNGPQIGHVTGARQVTGQPRTNGVWNPPDRETRHRHPAGHG